MIRKLTRNVLVYKMVVIARMLVVSSYAYVVRAMFVLHFIVLLRSSGGDVKGKRTSLII